MSLRAAVYARKSNLGKKSKLDAQTQSVLRQIDLAKAFIESRGWTVAEVYQDDGISGTIVRRAGLDAMLAAAAQKRRAFDAVVTMDLDRLAREMVFAPQTLDALVNDAGVEVWEYSTGQRLEYATAEQKMMASLRLFGGSHYVQSIAVKTAESLRASVREGPSSARCRSGTRHSG